MDELFERLKGGRASVAVLGLGYVGLPTAVAIAKSGVAVFGIDIQSDLVDRINRGKSHVSDVSDHDLETVVRQGTLRAFSNFEKLLEADVVLLCVPTPLTRNKTPDISYIMSATEEVARHLHRGQLIILESSTYPGTTREIINTRLEKTGLKVGEDYFLAFSPERIDPGNKMPFEDISRVVGGMTSHCTELAVSFYKSFIRGEVRGVSSPETAEMTKILENTFRLVNISLVNELALLAGKIGIDIWEVIEAAKSKPYGFMPFYPSPKIGGHCIGLDPFYLSFKAREYNFWARFIELAGEINEQMPHNVVTRVIWALNKAGKAVRGSNILVWGVGYKRDVGDDRESAAHEIIPDLVRKGAQVDYFDPHFPSFQAIGSVSNTPISLSSISYSPDALAHYDVVVILTDHSGYDYDEVAERASFVVDTRNAISSRKHKNVSWF